MNSFFVNFWILAALVAILLPPIIEWLFRRRKRRTELPTIRFLLDSRQQKKIRRQDRLLLILRMLAIFLLEDFAGSDLVFGFHPDSSGAVGMIGAEEFGIKRAFVSDTQPSLSRAR